MYRINTIILALTIVSCSTSRPTTQERLTDTIYTTQQTTINTHDSTIYHLDTIHNTITVRRWQTIINTTNDTNTITHTIKPQKTEKVKAINNTQETKKTATPKIWGMAAIIIILATLASLAARKFLRYL